MMRKNLIYFIVALFSVSAYSQTQNSLDEKDFTIKRNKYYENEEGVKVPLRYGQKYSKKTMKVSDENLDESYDQIETNQESSILIAINEDPQIFAERIIKSSKSKYSYLEKRSKEGAESFTFRYIPKNATNKEEYHAKKTCVDCMDIEFRKNPSDSTYTFSNVWGNFNDLFSVWKKIFKKDAKESDYQVTADNLLAEWTTFYGGREVAFGRLGEVWYIIMK